MNNPVQIGYWLNHCGLARIDAAALVGHVTGWETITLRIHPEYWLTSDELTQLESLKDRRLAGEPLAYILGEKEFFSLPFKVNSHVLIPRPDTECLVEWLIENVPQDASVVDLGTGSGCIAITLASKRPDLKIFASDIDPEAIKVAQLNANQLKVKVEFSVGFWLDAFRTDKIFDVIVSNPPYIRPDDEHLRRLSFEPLSALTDGKDGLESYRQILSQIRERQYRPKIVAFEHGWDQKENIQKILLDYGGNILTTYKDLGGNDRFTISME